MFSSALKSFVSNISSNYSIAAQPSSSCGPWKVFDAKRKATGKAASVFVFEKKSLEPQSDGLGGRTTSSSVRQAQNEVLERLKREASSLARLRHPNVLELVEPVEDARNGGLMFATEPVTASLASIMANLDNQDPQARRRYKVEDSEGTQDGVGYELDELEIQKGLLQIGKALEFLHESAGLVHANLTPDAIVINVKGDWKVTGMSFTGPASDSNKTSSSPAIFLSEVLNYDTRLPPSVQLNLDYTSPDFVMDNNLTSAADMFSLGLLIISLYNKPHRSPVECHGGLSSYKRIFASASTVPSRNNNFLAKGTLPSSLASDLLPRLITRRPAQRLSARAFQQAQYFDNILVSTIRFLDALPAKSASEKVQFLKGLSRIMSQFPTAVLDKKILPALLDEMKDKELLALILQNIFAIIRASQDGKRVFTTIVSSRLREVFLAAGGAGGERDSSKEAGLMVVLDNIEVAAANTTGREFHDDILPIIAVSLASPTHAVVDRGLSTLPFITPKLDYTTIKNELFPRIAGVFTQTKSLAIKIRGLEAIYTLCGGVDDALAGRSDGLDGLSPQTNENKDVSSAVLDRFTIQEKVIPMMKGIKTKEPAVMMAALKVFKQVGKVADVEYLATDVLPLLWSFALGPLLDLNQFQSFMALIKSISGHIEREHSRKLQDLSSGASSQHASRTDARSGAAGASNGDEIDFESLVSGRKNDVTPDFINDWGGPAPVRPQNATTSRTTSFNSMPAKISAPPTSSFTSPIRSQAAAPKTATPSQGMSAFASLAPTTSQPLRPAVSTNDGFGQSLQPSRGAPQRSINTLYPAAQATTPAANAPIDWSNALKPSPVMNGQSSMSGAQAIRPQASPALQPPPQPMSLQIRPQQAKPPAKTGLDKYESLI